MYDKNSVNKCLIIGNVGQQPETKVSQNNTQIANFSIATQTQAKDKEAKTEWHRVTAFGKLAEIVENYVQKGSQVYVEGRLQTDKFQDKEGNDKQVTKIIANQIQLLGGKGSSKGSSDGAQKSEPEPDRIPDDEGDDQSLPF